LAAATGAAQAINAASYDGVVFEMEHRPYDIRALRDCLQYMLDRRQILRAGTLAPAVTPFVRIPPNGGETSQWVAKQVLDQGVYGIVWPHVSTVEEARNAVTACRYPRPPEAAYFAPPGQRGDAPAAAARYWGLTSRNIMPAPMCGRSARRADPGRDHVRGGARNRALYASKQVPGIG
jgi:4-hydroxy-2-oxoheptanedioate aldolase